MFNQFVFAHEDEKEEGRQCSLSFTITASQEKTLYMKDTVFGVEVKRRLKMLITAKACEAKQSYVNLVNRRTDTR